MRSDGIRLHLQSLTSGAVDPVSCLRTDPAHLPPDRAEMPEPGGVEPGLESTPGRQNDRTGAMMTKCVLGQWEIDKQRPDLSGSLLSPALSSLRRTESRAIFPEEREQGMKPIVNLQDPVAKTVGRRKPPRDSFAAGMKLQRLAVNWAESSDRRFVPKGVYRFDSHEEADRWMWKMITRPRTKPPEN